MTEKMYANVTLTFAFCGVEIEDDGVTDIKDQMEQAALKLLEDSIVPSYYLEEADVWLQTT